MAAGEATVRVIVSIVTRIQWNLDSALKHMDIDTRQIIQRNSILVVLLLSSECVFVMCTCIACS